MTMISPSSPIGPSLVGMFPPELDVRNVSVARVWAQPTAGDVRTSKGEKRFIYILFEYSSLAGFAFFSYETL